ncbi:MAG: DUF4351 domain-containing protein [Acidobacteriia bacterium]|nr:DUF4351 domain-containing protein [Terriglobia bacterium]
MRILGREEGRHDDGASLDIRLLNRRVGTVTTAQKGAIRNLSLRKIRALVDSLLDFQSRADPARWRERHASWTPGSDLSATRRQSITRKQDPAGQGKELQLVFPIHKCYPARTQGGPFRCYTRCRLFWH